MNPSKTPVELPIRVESTTARTLGTLGLDLLVALATPWSGTTKKNKEMQ